MVNKLVIKTIKLDICNTIVVLVNSITHNHCKSMLQRNPISVQEFIYKMFMTTIDLL